MEFSSLDGADGEHNGDCFVETSKIFAMQAAFVFKMEPFDKNSLYQCVQNIIICQMSIISLAAHHFTKV